MLEVMGLMGLIFVIGLLFTAVWIVLLPFYLLFRLLGFAIKVGFAGIFIAVFGILLLPVALLVGAVLLLKLVVIGIPLLIVLALFGLFAGFFRRAEPRTVYVQATPPTST